MPPTKEDIIARIKNESVYHPPFGDQQQRYAEIRTMYGQFATLIVNLTPISREQSVALTLLDEATMMANAAIARNEVQE
jgi:hypothetical protein